MSAQTINKTSTEPVTGAEKVLWNLDDMFTGVDDPKIQSDIDAALKGAKDFKKKYYAKVAGLDAHSLNEAIEEQERVVGIMTRLGEYAYMYFSTDTSDPARGALLQKIQEQATAMQTELIFFELEWVAIGDDEAARLLGDTRLDKFRHHLESERRYKPHVLSEDEEKLLAEKSVSGSSAWSRLFTELMGALRVNIDGEEVAFEAASARLQMPDREVRRTAAEAITEALQPGLRTRSFIFNTLLLDKSTDDRLRKFPNWIASRNLSNQASDESVQALVDAVVSRYDIAQRYYKLKAKLLGLDRLADYDRMAPLAQDSSFSSWEEAKTIVLDAYQSFSPKAGSIIKQFFDDRWIDAAATPSKTPGAYCMTTVPDLHPFVLMSYTGDRRSVLTLAHELGHGLHGYLATPRGYFNAGTPLTLAETASVFGEALTFGRLLEAESDPHKQLDLLAGQLEDAIATVFRQIAMNRFEDAIHTARRETGELSIDSLSKFWEQTQSQLFADSVQITDGYKSWWSYIPHFIGSPGYVYAYAFGFLFSLAIYQKYVKEGDSMVEPYFELLAAGGSDAPERLAKIVGIDLGDPNFWAGGLEALDAMLGKAEDLAAKIG